MELRNLWEWNELDGEENGQWKLHGMKILYR